MIESRILLDSINPDGNRLITFVWIYPRFIHADVMTHRVLSRNASSSRAIPIGKMIERVLTEPALPIYWGKNQKGMRAEEELPEEIQGKAWSQWLAARDSAAYHASRMVDLGVHKQITNRLLEPFAHMVTIVTATEWGNLFNLRADPAAMPEFQELAYQSLEAYVASTSRKLKWGEWHLPFADKYEPEGLTQEQMLKIVTARCARVSYLNFEGDIDHEKDYKLHDDLRVSGHASPFEHAAQADPEPKLIEGRVVDRQLIERFALRSNLRGYIQYRKLLPNENREAFDPIALLARRKK